MSALPHTVPDFPFSPDLLGCAALYKRMIALDPGALAASLSGRLEPLGVTFTHIEEADAASEVTATTVLSNADMHLQIAIVDGQLPLQRLSGTQTSPFLQTHPAGFGAIARRHVSHVELRLGAGPMPEPNRPIPTAPDLPAELCIAILHRTLSSLMEQGRPEALIWYPSDMMLTPEELMAEEGSVLPALLFLHPAVWTPGCDEQGRRLTGFVAEHAEGWLGKPLEIEPTAHDATESRAVAAYLLRQSLAGRDALDDGARVPLGGGHFVNVRHLPGDEQFPAGRISVAFDPPFPAPVKQKNKFTPLHILRSFGTALGMVMGGMAAGVAGTGGRYSIYTSGGDAMNTIKALLMYGVVIGFSVWVVFQVPSPF